MKPITLKDSSTRFALALVVALLGIAIGQHCAAATLPSMHPACESDDRECEPTYSDYDEARDASTLPGSCVDRDVAICLSVIDWGGPRLQADHAAAYDVCIDVQARAAAMGFDGVWDRMIVAVAYWETGLDALARGPAGEVGPIQVMPRHFCPGGEADGCDGLTAGLRRMDELAEQFADSDHPQYDILCHYHGGTSCSDGEMDYAADIRSVMTRIREGFADYDLCHGAH